MASADRLIEVFNEAKARPVGAERDLFVAEACRDEPALKEQVLRLLQAHEGAGDFLKHTLFVPPVSPLTEKPGDRIGRYKLLEQIGEGGCGVVYMADQEEPVRRRVALKVIKLGMDTKNVIARFEAERQALALMDHPNIAKVLDAGATDTGRPYFVMELVRGIRITDYCDHNNVSTEERLKLFTQVCQAIQHAHQKGIIHRDIKPSNILVTVNELGAPGCPKVIDFGIAKATTGERLTDKTVFTAFEQFIGTPAYMSPEQAMMTSLDIDTRTDIYALGVLLYELLTGTTPFDAKDLMSAGLDAMRRIIHEQEPERPSTRLSTMLEADLTTVAKHRHSEPAKLGPLLRGDLDWIVMKALEKDRTRRYETASGLGMDVQRHLDNEPVTARPPSNLYRFQKLVRRNKLTVAAVGAVTAALIFGLGLSTWLFLRERLAVKVAAESALRAEANEKKATAEAAKSQQVAQFLKSMLNGVQPGVAMGRDTTMLREILDKTAARIDKDLKDQPDVEAELRSTIAEVYVVLGQYPSAEANHRKALAMRRKLLGNEHPDVATSLHNLAYLLREQGRPGADELALPLYSEALAIRRKVFGNESLEVASTLDHMGNSLRNQRKLKESESMSREALAIRKKLLGAEHVEIARSLDSLALILEMREKLVEGESLSRQALAMRIKVSGKDNPQVATCMDHLASFSIRNGNLAEAESLRREALALRKKILGNEHPLLVLSLNRLAEVLRFQKKAEAESLYREALAMQRRLRDNGSGEVAESLKRLADVLIEQGKLTEAEALYRERLKNLRGRVPAGDVKNATGLDPVAKTLLAQGKFAEAEPLARESLAIRQKNNSPEIVDSLALLVDVLRAGGKLAEAENLRREQLSEAERLGREELARRKKQFGEVHREIQMALSSLGQALQNQGKWQEAEAILREALAMEKKLSGEEHINNAWTLGCLASTLQQQGKLVEAETLTREQLAIKKKALGDHLQVSDTLLVLSDLLREQGKLTEAESLSREALAMRRRVLGHEHRDVDIALGHLANLLVSQGKLTEAEALSREELALEKKLSGDEHPFVANSLNHLAGILFDSDKLSEAETVFYQGLAMRKKLLGAEHTNVATSLAGLTKTLLAEKKFTEAETSARECLEIREKQLPNDWMTFNSQSMLGGSLLGQKKYADAEPLLISAHEGMKQREARIPVSGRPRMKESLQRLVQLYEATSRPEKAAEWNKRLAEFDKTATVKDAAVTQP